MIEAALFPGSLHGYSDITELALNERVLPYDMPSHELDGEKTPPLCTSDEGTASVLLLECPNGNAWSPVV